MALLKHKYYEINNYSCRIFWNCWYGFYKEKLYLDQTFMKTKLI